MKDSILQILYENCGKPVSGEFLAGRFGVSRNAVWKAVCNLRGCGYDISAVKNGGYILRENGVFSAFGIEKLLQDERIKVTLLKAAVSTNSVLKELAEKGGKEFTVIIAEEQTGGRGRSGRSFLSPRDCGLYMSILLRPKLCIDDVLLITSAAAVAVCRAVEKINPEVKAGIKWVNDVFIGGKKVCGILTETNIEDGAVSYAVLGIGINLAVAEVHNFLNGTVGGVFKDLEEGKNARTRLAAAVLEEFSKVYEGIERREFIGEYKSRSVITGREVAFYLNGIEKKGTVTGIDDELRLVVAAEEGEIALSSGEARILPLCKE